jgi:hypothetical protein
MIKIWGQIEDFGQLGICEKMERKRDEYGNCGDANAGGGAAVQWRWLEDGWR